MIINIKQAILEGWSYANILEEASKAKIRNDRHSKKLKDGQYAKTHESTPAQEAPKAPKVSPTTKPAAKQKSILDKISGKAIGAGAATAGLAGAGVAAKEYLSDENGVFED